MAVLTYDGFYERDLWTLQYIFLQALSLSHFFVSTWFGRNKLAFSI